MGQQPSKDNKIIRDGSVKYPDRERFGKFGKRGKREATIKMRALLISKPV